MATKAIRVTFTGDEANQWYLRFFSENGEQIGVQITVFASNQLEAVRRAGLTMKLSDLELVRYVDIVADKRLSGVRIGREDA